MNKSSRPSPQTAATWLRNVSPRRPTLALVLGSGFHHVLTELRTEKKVAYVKIPGFPVPGVSGHAGELYFGKLGGTPVLVLSGRAHFYEGHLMERVTFAVRTLAAFGIRDLLLTNAAGGINKKFRPGDFMVLTDHINFIGVNPLRPSSAVAPLRRVDGKTAPDLPRFVDMTQVYDPNLNALLFQAARRCKMKLYSGTYLALSGPSYETPAEIRAFATLGADAVGMSTVPEAMVARQCGLNVAAISCVTNLAAGRSKAELTHAEVLATANRVKVLAAKLLNNFAQLYGQI